MESSREEVVFSSPSPHGRVAELIEALRIARPQSIFRLYEVDSPDAPDSPSWFISLEADARAVYHIKRMLAKGVPVITVESELSSGFLDDDSALIFGPDPTDEEFVRGMLPFLESGIRMTRLRNGAQAAFVRLDNMVVPGAKPVVSVILLCYNQQHTIGRAIESLLGQVCDFPFEILVADDGSSDSTRAICEAYAEKYPHLIRLMPKIPNKGLVLNYFHSFDKCGGEFVADCAGDDYWANPLRLQKQVEYLRANPADVAVMSQWDIVENGTILNSTSIAECPQFSSAFSGPQLIQFILGFRKYLPFLSAMMFRRDVIKKIYSETPETICRTEWGIEDVPVLFHLARNGPVGYLPILASVYCLNPSGVSSGAGGDGYRFMYGLTLCISELCSKYAVEISDEAGRGMNRRLVYLASIILANPTSVRIKEFDKLCDSWPRPLSLKIRIYRAAFKSAMGIRVLRFCKKLV